tara:strand:+ start:184 stop:357 length:174 start_codon:yes stop_codon:yes gene_type:complete
MSTEERQRIIALFNAGGLNPMMDLSRLSYSDVITRFVRVYELIETNVRDSLTNQQEK